MYHFSKSALRGPTVAPEVPTQASVSQRQKDNQTATAQLRGSSSIYHNAVSPSFYGYVQNAISSATDPEGYQRQQQRQQIHRPIAHAATADERDMAAFSNRSRSGAPAYGNHSTAAAPSADYIRRTGSGGLILRVKRSFEDQEEVSRAKAAELSALYELSDVKESDLNRKAVFKTHHETGLSIAHSMTSMQAAAAMYAEQEEKAKDRVPGKVDPLLTQREMREKKRKEEVAQRKAAMKERNKKAGPSSTKNKYANGAMMPSSSSRVAPAASANDENVLPGASGYEGIAPKYRVGMVPSIVVQSTSSAAKRDGFRAANGMYYDVPNLC